MILIIFKENFKANPKIMDQKTEGIVSYLWWIGLLIVMFTRKIKTEYTSFHIRQSLGLMICSFIASTFYYLPLIGEILWVISYLVLFVLWIIAFIGALNEEKRTVPIIGGKFQEWFRSV